MPFRRLTKDLRNTTQNNKKHVDTLVRTRLPVDLVAMGMRIISLDRPWTEVPVLFQGFTVETPNQLSILRQYCDWVLVESTSRLLKPLLDQIEVRRKRREQPLPETRTLHEELPRAQEAFRTGQLFVQDILSQIEAGRELDLSEARPVIKLCVESISANPNAMFWMNRIKHEDAYTAEHCLRVAILAVAFARYLGMPQQDLEAAGLCGMLHDIGKMRVPGTILNKPGALTRDEMDEMRRHTEYGYEMLLSHHTLDPIVANVCRDHHERIDGKGYPRKLEEWQISRFARLISIVDVFDAITSDRVYRAGMPTTDAMRILFQERGKQFDPEMVEAFIRMVGIYPPGSLVELNTGEVAVVIATHPSFKLRPRVEILLGADKTPAEPRLLDLKDEPVTESGETYAIATSLPDGAYGITLADRISQLTGRP
ncbi:HD-GYP domain-containing protein [Marinobacter nanhaiticus D15-8W]|uniref:HD-GYP domain-containing protein n=1 Tax=Marinobacter nanhaiticus D15-8W TaxID=626887 RepID=N6X2V0_9GAMM|nr:HD-GYP domain-containing protein [Marinobacter nanhaiticus]ENO15413.2 HD-GYP domain-containing protein [Marinobacter nanhaiticus D15-8W]